MKTAGSALSNIMTPDSSSPFGKNPLVKRLLRGMFNLQPSIPKHVNTYDVDVVLQYLEGLGDADAIPFQFLTFCLVTLFCLLSGQRDQTFAAIDIRLMDVSDDRVVCYIDQVLKTTRPDFHQSPIDFCAFPDNKAICPVYNTQQYLFRSFSLPGPRVNCLFVTHFLIN